MTDTAFYPTADRLPRVVSLYADRDGTLVKLMVQEPVNSLRSDFQNAVMQAIIE